METTARRSGPSLIGLVFDEFAHIGGSANPDSDTSSTNVYRAAKPAVVQFPRTGLTLQTSSPWEKHGQLYETYQLGCEVNPDGTPKLASLAVVQVPSWTTYEHWERGPDLEMWPGGPRFPAHDGPIIDRKGLLEIYEEIDPDAFATEYGAQFASGTRSYLNSRTLARLIVPYEGWDGAVHKTGADNRRYAAHGDPSRVGDHFGFAIAHVRKDPDGIPHVFFDDAFSWKPKDFPDDIIDYRQVEADITEILTAYPVTTLTFDQYDSAGTIDRLRSFAAAGGGKCRTNVFERTATAPYNWRAFEIFKSAAMMGLIHIPESLTELLEELEYLQVDGQRVDHPTTGPVRRKDIADAAVNVVYALIGENWDATFERLASVGLHARPGITGPSLAPPVGASPFSIGPLSEDELMSRLGSGGGLAGVGARRGAVYDPSRGPRRRRRGF
ncbi:MAG: hypothetical protein U0P45_05815 [Acidimicrobiales bacterium]